MYVRLSAAGLTVLAIAVGVLMAQEHNHHGDGSQKKIAPPKIFLDKSLRIVEYQLRRLDNERLLLVERKTDHPKYAPVYTAILSRAGMSPQYREEALASLIKLNKSDAVSELLKTMANMDADDRQERRTGRQLANLLLRLPQTALKKRQQALKEATGSENRLIRSVAHAALIAAGDADVAWTIAQQSNSATLDWLAAVPLTPGADTRASLRDPVCGLVSSSHPTEVRRAAIQALAAVPNRQAESFQLIAPLATDKDLRVAAVRTMLRIPPAQRDAQTSRRLVEKLVAFAERTPAKDRTTDDFIDAMQLADQLLGRIPVAEARSYRERLREITVRVVRIHTVEEEMRFDTPYFAVEAGRPVQVILQNEDLMPHNLVVTAPGALKEVAQLGLAAGPTGHQGKQYVPNSDKVLYATNMVQPSKQERLTFTAPKEPGEYPYVCTFPRHWMRMYGVMVVVPDLDAWLQSPTKPKDPIGSNRSFVKAWSIDDFRQDIDQGLLGRTPEIGKRLFTEGTCAQCHKVQGEGGAVGPELTDVFKRWKGDRLAVLREMLEPSHRIDPKYAVHVIYTLDGRVVTGIVTAEDKKVVSILDNPESPKPTTIKRADIDEMLKTSKSMMPKALLDRFSKDEIFELLAYLESVLPSGE